MRRLTWTKALAKGRGRLRMENRKNNLAIPIAVVGIIAEILAIVLYLYSL